jgi:hypothetical protein
MIRVYKTAFITSKKTWIVYSNEIASQPEFGTTV